MAEVRAQLAPTGVLRAGINMGNPLLVTGRSADGGPEGVAPDMAHAIAERLGVTARLVPFPSPGEIADAVDADAWDIALIGAEPQRAEKIEFTVAYAEIESTYLVPAGSPIGSIDDVDRPGVRLIVSARSAYGLWLERNIRHATLIPAGSPAEATQRFGDEGLDALAGLRPALAEDAARFPGSRVLPGQFASVQQAVGTRRANVSAAAFLRAFVEEAKATGLVARLIEEHGVQGRL
ncbi:MAG: ABC transporter substrate-binding protein, partial [Chloroflexi bacterium]|nr:ABC transporter substrate-binding protein [Chloroflexota bacterium]